MSVAVKISSKSARLPFHGCEPAFIRDVCHGRCCDAPSRPTGTLITIHPVEQPRIEAQGVVVQGGLLQPRPGCRVCPFKTPEHLCGLHGTPIKPFGCIASPFTLNGNDTLIVRNRYKLLPCYKAGPQIPAYRAFAASLHLLFGHQGGQEVIDRLDAGEGDFTMPMDERIHAMLRQNDAIKRRAH